MYIKRTVLRVLVLGAMIPALALAAGGGGGGGGGGSAAAAGTGSGTQLQDQTRDRIQDPTTHTGDEPLQTRDQDQTRLYMSTTSTTTVPAGAGQMNQYQSGGQAGPPGTTSPGYGAETQYRLQIDPEHLQVRAGTSAQLGQMVQQREQELAQQASTTPQPDRPALMNANRVRLGVYAILAAGDLLPGQAGQQMAQIANQVDTSLQTSANLVAQVQNRGFFTRFFFGGDADSGKALAQIATENQARIEQMTQLLSQASTTPAVQAQLATQLTTMQQEQARLAALGLEEQNQWGLFSWRF